MGFVEVGFIPSRFHKHAYSRSASLVPSFPLPDQATDPAVHSKLRCVLPLQCGGPRIDLSNPTQQSEPEC